MIRGMHCYLPPRLLALGLGEVFIIGGCFVLATFVRLQADAYFALNYQGGFLKIGLVCFICVFCLYLYGLYDSRVFTNRRELVCRTPQVVGTATIVLGLLYYLYPPLGLGRGIFVLGVVPLCFGLVGYRLAFLWLSRALPFVENTLVMGEGSFARDLAEEIRSRPELGLRVVGLVSENGRNPTHRGSPEELQVVGGVAQLSQLVADLGVDRLIVAMQDRRGKLPVDDLLQLKAQGLAVEEGIRAYESISGRIALASLTPGWLVFADGFGVSRLHGIGLRALSLSAAAFGLVLSAPIMIVLAGLIKLDSQGSVFFRQERVGKRGRTFYLLKFRSMCDGAESATGPVWAQVNDPRITRVGSLMRKGRLDELPQLINVLRGDMNLVGPRPERPYFVEELRRKNSFYDYRHMVKPGITGWAQIKYSYAGSDLSQMEKLQYDLFYCKNRSLGLDLLVLFHTVKIVLLGLGAR